MIPPPGPFPPPLGLPMPLSFRDGVRYLLAALALVTFSTFVLLWLRETIKSIADYRRARKDRT